MDRGSNDAMAGGGDTRKYSSAAANKAGARDHHGASPTQKGQKEGRQENKGGKTLGVRGNDRGREASEVAHESPGVGEKEGGRDASGVAENPRGSRHGVGGGVESPQGTNTPGVAELSWGDNPPEGPQLPGRTEEGWMGAGRG